MSRLCALLFLSVFTATTLTAQTASRADSVFARARRLVNEGAGAQGRALIDSLVRATPDGSAARADAIYWRAALAPDAAAAQRDYVLLTVEYGLTARAADALLGLAQLEFARGDLPASRRHLERMVLEHPAAASATEGWYWLGRVRIDMNEVALGCTALDNARKALPTTDVERRNQVDFAAQPCKNLPAGGAAPATPPATSPPATTPPARASTTPPPATATAGAWTVQVAAFNTKAEGTRLVSTLTARGYEARVIDPFATGPKLYRVRVGFYATRAEASAVVAKLKTQRIDAIVAEAEQR
jgi:cell division septation protein DedD